MLGKRQSIHGDADAYTVSEQHRWFAPVVPESVPLESITRNRICNHAIVPLASLAMSEAGGIIRRGRKYSDTVQNKI